jgi:hypothetical protein
MRSINLMKLAAEAELLRYRCMAARQGRRAAFGAIALVFVLAVLVLGEVAAWLALYLLFAAIPTTLKVLNRGAVMQEKARFVRRWPERSYRPRQNSITVSCINEEDKLCLVTGLVDFECRSSERHAASNGVARFKAAIFFEGEEPRIVGEDSEVLG